MLPRLLESFGSFSAWIAVFPALPAVRIILSLLIFPLLYRALGEEGQGWGGGTTAVARRALFSVIGAVVFFSLTANWLPEERSPDYGRGFKAYLEGAYLHRLSHSSLGTS